MLQVLDHKSAISEHLHSNAWLRNVPAGSSKKTVEAV
jgi:hypothetical protein